MRSILVTMTAVVLTIVAGVGVLAGVGRGSVGPPRDEARPAVSLGAPGGAGSPPSAGVCASAELTEGALVTRSPGFPANHGAFSFPARVRLRSTAGAQALRLLCALPPLPAGVMSCPADFAVQYLLRFSFRSRSPIDVRLDPTGCETVTGLGQVRWIAREPAFWPSLGRALGLAAASQSTFAGSMAS